MGVTRFPNGISIGPVPPTAASIPADGTSKYDPGHIFQKTDADLGQCALWVNQGSSSSSAFRPEGPVIGYGFTAVGGPVVSAGGDTTETITIPAIITAADISFVEHAVSDDIDQIDAQVAGAGTITITASADPLAAHSYHYAALRSGCVPDYDIVFAGTATTAGGSTAEAITLTGALATDIGFATYSATDDTDIIAKTVMTANTMTVTMSADPLTAHGLHYMVLRPRGSFKPSHYVAYAGVHTTVGGSTAEAITVTGSKSTDVAIVKYNTSNDTDTILKAVMTANTLTVTMSADPLTAHKLAYAILRAY